MGSMCGCNCGYKHLYGKFLVEPLETKWFVDNNHKDKYLAEKRNAIPVTEYTGE